MKINKNQTYAHDRLNILKKRPIIKSRVNFKISEKRKNGADLCS
jgi:hypothetical protein